VFIPLAYLWAIGRYRLLDLNLRLRRHVQYSLVSAIWGLLPLAVLLWLLLVLPRWTLPIPNVRVAGSSVEVLQTPIRAEQRAVIEKLVLMVVAIGLAFTLRSVARRGQHWLASQFYRAEHDYRRAAKEVFKLVAARPDLDGLSMGLVDAVVRLLQVKRAGAVFFRERQTFCSCKGQGFTNAEWKRVSNGSDDILEGVRKAQEEVAAEYVFPRLRRLLTDVEVQYLFPLRSHDELVGALLIGEKLAEDVFREEDFEFLGALAAQVAPAVENAFLYHALAQQERLKHELELARRIQMESLPQSTPRVEGLDIAGVSIPAFEVGGDYFDYLNGNPGHLTVMVGDVSGKGTSAALYMSRLQGIVRSLHAFDLSPHEFFVRTNDLLCRDLERRSFVTAIGGFFDAGQRQMVLARAGHLPLYYYSAATAEVHRVLPRGLGFGLSNRHVFEHELEEQLIAYRPGDVFLFITDGITESVAPSGDDFGEDRVLWLLERHAHATALEIRDEVTEAVRAFSATEEQFDDQTVVVVKAT
jgi:serine phosphatase RsbU (regulator of sigma subunit)